MQRSYPTRWIVGERTMQGIATQTKVDKQLAARGHRRAARSAARALVGCAPRSGARSTAESSSSRSSAWVAPSTSMTSSSPCRRNTPRRVRKVFCDWYHDDLIYRGKRIVNWCPQLHHRHRRRRGGVQGREAATCGTCATRLDRAGRRRSTTSRCAHHAPRDHARRHGRRRLVPKTATRRSSWARRSCCPSSDREIPIFSDFARRRGIRLRFREGHARARSQRLRDGPAQRTCSRSTSSTSTPSWSTATASSPA